MNMTLGDLFDSLAVGELSNLSISNDGAGPINPAQQPKLVKYTNEGLTRLYSRFVLKEDDLLIEQHEYITNYHLLEQFAENFIPAGDQPDEPIRYIKDLPREPFKSDVLRVLTVHDDQGDRIPLNDDTNILSVFTPQFNVLQVPVPTPERTLAVLYQAKHPKLTGDLDQPVVVPDTLLSALTSYVAFKVFSHMNSKDSTTKAQEFLATYELNCNEVLTQDLVNSSVSNTNERFHIRGWF